MAITFVETMKKTTQLFIYLLLFFLLSACSQVLVKDAVPLEKPVWPAPPMEAKIEWVKDYQILTDTASRKGFWGKVGDFFLGPKSVGMVRPYGVCTDNNQQLFIADAGGAKVHIFNMEDGHYFAVEGNEKFPLISPIGLVHVDNYLYITDSAQGQIFEFDLKKKNLRRWTPFKFDRPTGIAYDSVTHLIYVSDTAAHQIVVLDRNGSEQFRIGQRGVGAGEFNFPTDIWIDGAEGRVYVTDSLNARIQIFSVNGDYLGQFGQPGDTPGSFSKPKGVAVDQHGHIFVCDALFDAVQIFDKRGRILLSFGENGSKPGQFWMPSGIFIDKQSNIYVVDTYNRRIQVFRELIKAVKK